MTLKSNLFAGDAKLETAAASHTGHITPGAVGPHVKKIQAALAVLDGAVIDQGELDAGRYGPSTARAVLEYKKKRDIINRSYQSQADNVVGIMTIKAMDEELLSRQVEMPPGARLRCGRICVCARDNRKETLLAALSGEAKRGSRPDIGAAMRKGLA